MSRRAVAVLGLALAPTVAWSETAILPATAVALQRHTAGTFYVDGAIEGYGELKMLVDTGSSYVVIGEVVLAALEAAGDAEYSRELSGVMADGSRRVIPIYRLSGLRLGDSCWVEGVEAAVFPGATRPILGMNILSRLAPFTFSAEPPQLALNRCQASLTPQPALPAVASGAVPSGTGTSGSAAAQ